MNWYQRYFDNVIKHASIWDVDSSGTLLDEIKKIYELEYKLNMLRLKPFAGLPQRQENIADKIEGELEESLEGVMNPFLKTFEVWLRDHALNDPEAWSVQRNNPPSGYDDWDEYYSSTGEEEETRLSYLAYEYFKFTNKLQENKNFSPKALFNNFINNNILYISNLPSVKKFEENVVAPYEKEQAQQEAYDNLDEFNHMYGTSFEDPDDASDWIENNSHDLFADFADYLDTVDLNTLYQNFVNSGLLDEFIQEVNRDILFPLWHDWANNDSRMIEKSQGRTIEQSRAGVEATYERLQSAETLNEKIQAINMAIGTVHHTGDMVDHLENYSGLSYDEIGDTSEIKQVLDDMTAGKNVEKWNEELRSIGVAI